VSTGALCYLLDADGDLAVGVKRHHLQLVSGLDAIAQIALTRLQLAAGEWRLDATAGLDHDRVLGFGRTDRQVESEVRRVLESTPGLSQVIEVSVTRSGRAATVTWEALASTGDPLVGALEV